MEGKLLEPLDTVPMGENPGMDFRRSTAIDANRIVTSLANKTAIVDLGREHGEIEASRLRFRDALKEGHLRMYVRQKGGEHKKEIAFSSTVIALGIVAAGVRNLKHH